MKDTLVNIEAEGLFLGALLIDNRSVDRVADKIEGHDFSEPVHQTIYEAIVREVSLGKPANGLTLRPYFENLEALKPLGGAVYLMRLTANCMGCDIYETAKFLADLAHRRRMRAGLLTASDACADMETTLGEIISHADAAVAERSDSAIAQPTAAEALGALLDNLGNKVPGVTCDVIPEVDAAMGPIRPKQLAIVAGRPGMGKTAFALSYALGAALQGHGVLFVSLEMSAAELAERMASDLSFHKGEGVPYSAIRDGDLNSWQRKEVAKSYSQMQSVPFQIVDAGSLTTGRLSMLVRRHARRMAAAGHKLELIVIDYLQLLSPDGKPRSNYEAVSEVSRNLKALAKDNNVGIMALAQLSRTVETRPDKTPQLSDLRDSGQIEQDADAVMFLLRQEYYLKQGEIPLGDPKRAEWETKMNEWQGVIEFIVAKRRNGTAGRSEGRFHGTYQAVRGRRDD